MIKGYGLSPEHVIHRMSYANILMLGAVLPSYDRKPDDKGSRQEGPALSADDPANRARIREIFNSVE